MTIEPANNARVLVTGASGFVGECLTAALAACGRSVWVAFRHPATPPASGLNESVVLGDLDASADWTAA